MKTCLSVYVVKGFAQTATIKQLAKSFVDTKLLVKQAAISKLPAREKPLGTNMIAKLCNAIDPNAPKSVTLNMLCKRKMSKDLKFDYHAVDRMYVSTAKDHEMGKLSVDEKIALMDAAMVVMEKLELDELPRGSQLYAAFQAETVALYNHENEIYGSLGF